MLSRFKERWEITENWQLVHPILGILVSLVSGYIFASRLPLQTSIADSQVAVLLVLVATIFIAMAIIQLSLWCFRKLKNRWKVDARWEYIAIFLCFAVTGSSAARLSGPLMELLHITKDRLPSFVYWLLRIVVLFPIYNVLLVAFGWLFGQSKFFVPFAKRMLRIGKRRKRL